MRDIFFRLNENIAGRRGIAAMPDLAAGVGGGHLAKIIAADDIHAAFEEIRIADAEHTADAAAAGCTSDEDAIGIDVVALFHVLSGVDGQAHAAPDCPLVADFIGPDPHQLVLLENFAPGFVNISPAARAHPHQQSPAIAGLVAFGDVDLEGFVGQVVIFLVLRSIQCGHLPAESSGLRFDGAEGRSIGEGGVIGTGSCFIGGRRQSRGSE